MFRSDGVTGSEIQQRGGVGREKGGMRGDGRKPVNELRFTFASQLEGKVNVTAVFFMNDEIPAVQLGFVTLVSVIN